MSVDLTAAALRALTLASALQAMGAVVFLRLFQSNLFNTQTGIRRLSSRSALVAAVLTLLQLPIHAAQMGGELASALDPELERLALESSIANAAAVSLVGLTLIACCTQADTRVARISRLAGVALVAGSFALTGHTFSATRSALLGPVLLLHVLIAAFWFGGLVPLYWVTVRESRTVSARLVARYSKWATGLVPFLFLAGLGLMIGLLPDLHALREPYGKLLLGKVAAFGVLLVFAAMNKWRLGPRMALDTESTVAQWFRGSLIAEYLLMIGVLGMTAALTTWFGPPDE